MKNATYKQAIIHHSQRIELESCSNPLLMQQVFYCSSDGKKHFSFRVYWGQRHNWRIFSSFFANFTGPGRQSNEPFFGLIFYGKLGCDPRL